MNLRPKLFAAGAAAVAVGALGASISQAATPALAAKAKNLNVITSALNSTDKVRVIVKFGIPKSNLYTKTAIAKRKAAVVAGQNGILTSAFGSVAAANSRGVSRMKIEPMFAISVNQAELERLAADSRVTAIYRDKINKPFLLQSIPLVGADELQQAGGTGKGFVVSIIDSGVERTHDFIHPRVVMGACFTSNEDGYIPTCKGGKTEDEGKKAGDPCTGSSSCFHGTHVAGIAAGRLTHKADHPNEPTVGVAPKASIVAINVFSRNGTDLGAFDSDIEKALEWTLEHRVEFPGLTVASANMSLGDGTENVADCDADAPLTDVINDMRAANIATVIASGNEGYRDAVAYPACISGSIAVGATTKSDIVASFSNMGDLVDVLAPGASIRSSVLDNVFGVASGTSMAAPHVTGTWAALRSLHPDATVSQIEKALEKTGVKIEDTRTDGIHTKPRIQLDDANQYLSR